MSSKMNKLLKQLQQAIAELRTKQDPSGFQVNWKV